MTKCPKCGYFCRGTTCNEVCLHCGYGAVHEEDVRDESIDTNEKIEVNEMTEEWNGQHDKAVGINIFGGETIYVDPKTVTKELIQSLANSNRKASYYVEKDGELVGPSSITSLEAGDVVEIKAYTKPGFF